MIATINTLPDKLRKVAIRAYEEQIQSSTETTKPGFQIDEKRAVAAEEIAKLTEKLRSSTNEQVKVSASCLYIIAGALAGHENSIKILEQIMGDFRNNQIARIREITDTI